MAPARFMMPSSAGQDEAGEAGKGATRDPADGEQLESGWMIFWMKAEGCLGRKFEIASHITGL